MQEILAVLANVSVLVFVVSSMLAMGLGLTVKQIADPMRNFRPVLLMPLGGELGKRQAALAPAGDAAAAAAADDNRQEQLPL